MIFFVIIFLSLLFPDQQKYRCQQISQSPRLRYEMSVCDGAKCCKHQQSPSRWISGCVCVCVTPSARCLAIAYCSPFNITPDRRLATAASLSTNSPVASNQFPSRLLQADRWNEINNRLSGSSLFLLLFLFFLFLYNLISTTNVNRAEKLLLLLLLLSR